MTRGFIERLTMRSWLFSVLPFLVRSGGGRFGYIDASEPALTLARLTGGLFDAKFETFDFRMLDIRDETGAAMRMRITCREMSLLQEDIAAQPEFQEWLSSHTDLGPRLGTFLAKSVAVRKTEEGFDLWRALYLIWVCRSRMLKDADESEAVLFLERQPWFASLQRYSSPLRVSLVAVPAFPSTKKFLLRRLDPRVLDLLRFLRAHGLGGLKLWLTGDKLSPPAPTAPRLAVEYYGHLNLDDATRPSNLFFWQNSKIPGKDIVILYGLFKDRLNPRRLEEIRRHQLDAVAIHPSAASDVSLPVFVPVGQRDSAAGSLRPRSPEALWLEERTCDYSSRRAFWAELFERTGVKVFLTWYKNDPNHCAIADALQELGGVTAIYQRSLEMNQNLVLAADTDIYFAFSRASTDLAKLNGSNIRYNVVTGYFGDYLFAPLKQRARELRESLLKNGARKIVAVFDEYSPPDTRWWPGEEPQRDNYRLLTQMVLSEPWLGVIFKPKSPQSLRRRLGPELAEQLARAEATGRCRVLEQNDFLSDQTPAEAAMAADVAVHGHLSASTAGMEAALAGVPTLLVDPEGWLYSPLYRLGEGRVIFRDWPSLWDALRRHWNEPSGVPGFGDWTPMLEELDPFRDGRAAERIGEFLDWILQDLKNGRNREAAMASAAQRYAERWGQDKVTTIAGPSWLRQRTNT